MCKLIFTNNNDDVDHHDESQAGQRSDESGVGFSEPNEPIVQIGRDVAGPAGSLRDGRAPLRSACSGAKVESASIRRWLSIDIFN